MLESVGQCSHTLRNDVHVSTHIYQSLNILCTLIVKFKQDGLLVIVLAVDVYTFLQQSKDDIQILNTRSFEDSGTSWFISKIKVSTCFNQEPNNVSVSFSYSFYESSFLSSFWWLTLQPALVKSWTSVIKFFSAAMSKAVLPFSSASSRLASPLSFSKKSKFPSLAARRIEARSDYSPRSGLAPASIRN